MLLSYAFLIPPLHTHSALMGLQFVLYSHHLEQLYQVASTSIEFRVSSERLGSRRASRLKVEEHYVVSVLPVSSLFLRASEDELRLGKGETADRNRLIGPVSLQETNLTDYIPSILI